MRLTPATLAFLLLAAAAAGAEGQGGAPLEASKQALKSLEADRAAGQNAVTTGRMSDSLPKVETPGPGPVAPDFSQLGKARKDEKDLKKKRAEQKNWLLDGVNKLGRDARGRSRPAGDDPPGGLAEAEDEKPDSSDPDFILKTYNESKRESEAKAGARPARTARSDPIAPFLQGWMGDSPVRGKFFDEFVRKTDAGTGLVATDGPVDAGLNRNLSSPVATRDQRAVPLATLQPNPYLAGLESPAAAHPGSGGSPDDSLAAPLSIGGTAGAPGIPAIAPPPAARPAEKKPPMPSPADNEKYFPQQKKF